ASIKDFAEALAQACRDEANISLPLATHAQPKPASTSPSNPGGATTYRLPSDSTYALAWSPDGRKIASGGLDRTVQVRETTTGASSFIYRGHTGSISALVWSHDGQYIASAGLDKTIQVWNATNGKRLTTYDGHYGMIYALAWSPNGKYIAST